MDESKKLPLAIIILLVAIVVGFLILDINTGPDFSDYDVVYPSDLPDFDGVSTDSDQYLEEVRKLPSRPIIAEDTDSYAHLYTKNDDVEWLEHPELVGEVELFSENVFGSQNRLFYRIGYDAGNDILVTTIPCDGICSDRTLFFMKANDIYYFLANHSDNVSLIEGEYPKDAFADSVIIDAETRYEALSYPNEIIANGEKFDKYTGLGSGIRFFANIKQGVSEDTRFQLEAVTEYGPLYSLGNRVKDTVSRLTRYYLRLRGGLSVPYDPVFDFVGDDSVPDITWISDGIQNTRSYKTNSVGGCGSSATEVVPEEYIYESDIELIGLTKDQKPIYGLTSADHFLVEKLYDVSRGRYYDYNPETRQGEAKEFSKESIVNEHLIFLYKDTFGDYVVFSSTQHAPAAECAKPVIYLYPEEKTEVSVQVGADIKKSEPLYEEGWNVVAYPNGTLDYNGKEFDSLFWDGVGYGEYPFPDKGFVVENSEIENTLNKHLDAFGLNNKEKNDFMEFWLPHMPDTPYVRISWITTEEMDGLAPLFVRPKPDTILRIFMDFEGLDTPIDIEPQDIVSVDRRGFTLIEWGGLLVK